MEERDSPGSCREKVFLKEAVMSSMAQANRPLAFGVIIGSRNFFNSAHARGVRQSIARVLADAGHEMIIGEPDLTNDGAVATLEDAKKYAALFAAAREKIAGIIVLLANFGDEIAVVETLRRAGLNVPVLVQACPDRIDEVGVRERRDAYCGKISVCANLKQYGIAWTDTASHTVDPASGEFAADLEGFVRICRTVKGLRNARIGAIGARPGAFQTVRYSEKLLQASGITVTTVDLSEILAGAQVLEDSSSEVLSTLKSIRSYGKIPSSISHDHILNQTKFSVAVQTWLDSNECDASAIQCWNSLEQNYGCAACLTMSMESQALRPSACEVDVTGAVSMLALTLAADSPAALLDWNNNYADRNDMVVCTHCSNFPAGFMGSAIEISNLDLLGETFGAERCFGAIKGHVAPGPFTYFRLSSDDQNGTLKCYLGEGEFTSDPFPMDGGIAVCRIPDIRQVMRHVTREGFEHHVAMVRGQVADVLEEAIVRYLGWKVCRFQ